VYDQIKAMALKALKLPSEPSEPMGEAGGLKVFRASRNYLLYRLFFWGASNLFAAAALLVAGAVALQVIPQKAVGHQTEAYFLVLGIWLLLLVLAAAKTALSYVLTRLDYEMRWYMVSDRSLRIREGVTFVQEITMTFAKVEAYTR